MGIPEDITMFEQRLNELIIKYEQYFIGIEKREPLKLLDRVERMSRQHQPAQIVNTMMKFRYNSLIAKLNTYKQYWCRITRLIEEGKYSRDRFKMEMRQNTNLREQTVDERGGSDSDLERLYQQYIEARKACNLSIRNITQEKIAAAIERQKPAIIRKYHCAKVEFKVVIEGGAPKIKVRPGVQ